MSTVLVNKDVHRGAWAIKTRNFILGYSFRVF